MNLTWTEEEKLKLLEALQQLGVQNLQLIAASVGTKTAAECDYAIKLYEQAALNSLKEFSPTNKNREAPIDKWLNFFKKLSENSYNSKDIIAAFRLIAQYEEKENSDVDLNDCYNFIADLMCGTPPKLLNEETEKFIILCIVKLSEIVNKLEYVKEQDFLNNLKFEDIVAKSYASKVSVVTDPAINTLKVPKELLKMKNITN